MADWQTDSHNSPAPPAISPQSARRPTPYLLEEVASCVSCCPGWLRIKAKMSMIILTNSKTLANDQYHSPNLNDFSYSNCEIILIRRNQCSRTTKILLVFIDIILWVT
jgi:hypothetical protein